METRILLGDVEVGAIRVVGLDRDETEFTFFDSYRERYPRPVLGQAFVGHLSETFRRRQRLHPYFSNLLPEGPLRRLIADSVGVAPGRELFLLNRIGANLPGAVVARPLTEGDDEAIEDEDASADARLPMAGGTGQELHFSLAGMQLKFSMFEDADRGMTLPMSGEDGKWVVKLPDPNHADVPSNEWSMMTWARAAGLDVPELRLLKVTQLHGLPKQLTFREPWAFAARRFDRRDDGARVHVEDFAQILGVYGNPQGKYRSASYEQLGRIILGVAGEASLEEFIRRLVFNIAIGNGDAHVKNWALMYPDGLSARLAPAYDLVFTALYVGTESLALNLGGSRRFEDADEAAFRRWAKAVGYSDDRVIEVVRGQVESTRDAWDRVREDMRLTRDQRALLKQHQKRTALFR